MKIPAVMPDGTAMAAGIFLDKSIRGGVKWNMHTVSRFRQFKN